MFCSTMRMVCRRFNQRVEPRSHNGGHTSRAQYASISLLSGVVSLILKWIDSPSCETTIHSDCAEALRPQWQCILPT